MINFEFDKETTDKMTVTTFVEKPIKQGLKNLAKVERRSVSQMTALLIEQAVQEAIQQGRITPPNIE